MDKNSACIVPPLVGLRALVEDGRGYGQELCLHRPLHWLVYVLW